MNIHHVMIGDWVQLTDPINDKEMTKVEEIHHDGYITVDGGLTRQYSPIPLTTEILEKNGFELEKNEYGEDNYYIFDDDSNNCLYLEICNSGRFAAFGNPNVVITSIHELQHALRLCGIEKEIEL